jgi:hypothetical protein
VIAIIHDDAGWSVGDAFVYLFFVDTSKHVAETTLWQAW